MLMFCLTAAVALSAVCASSATAADIPPFLTPMGEKGTGAGQFQEPRSLVASPTTGHIYAVDSLRGQPTTNRILEFTAWGEFVKAWGWGVRDGTAELQACGPGATPPSALCLPGLAGGGAGQLNQPTGIAMDSAGDLFVFDRGNARVQKFSPDGEFILTFGRGVNQTSGGDICTAASGHTCRAGILGTGNGQFGVEVLPGTNGNYIAVSPSGAVYVGDNDRIQEFDAAGAFVDSIALPEPGRPGALVLDPTSGDLYFAFSQEAVPATPSTQPDVYRLDPDTGSVIDELRVAKPLALAADRLGNVYVVLEPVGESQRIVEFDSSGAPVITPEDNFTPTPSVASELKSLATNTVTVAGGTDLLIGFEPNSRSASIGVFGPPPDKWPPPLLSPRIDGQFASEVDADSAVVKAEINPRFWADTRYFVEFGTEPCSEGGCTSKPAPPGDLLGAGVVSTSVTTAGIEFDELEPGTRYFFRFVSESTGGGPVVGQGDDELEGTFRTPTPFQPTVNCPNQEFRTGSAAFLPDCRAYEMVSPVDKAGGDVIVQCNISCIPARLDQAAESGGGLTYSAFRAFGDAQSSPYSSQYLAKRGPNGWSTHGISPVQEGATPLQALVLDVEFRAFSPDLGQAWFTHSTEPVLAPGAIAGFSNIYRLDTAADTYEAVTTKQPSDVGPGTYEVELQGLSADGNKAVFRAKGKLTPNASARALSQVYESENGSLKLVSLRPSNTPALQPAGVGSSDLFNPQGRSGSLFHAVSVDGSRIFWSEPLGNGSLGQLFARIDGQETITVSAAAEFVTADPAGATALFRTPGQELVEFDVDTRQPTTIADGVLGVVGSSESLSRIYFVSTEDLAEGAIAGQPNLYLRENGQQPTVVATLDPADVSELNPFAAVNLRPNRRATRVTPDGGVLVFMSRAKLTGYDSADLDSGEPNYEVFRYDAQAASLSCISCNPTGTRPSGRLLVGENRTFGLWGAAQIPTWPSQLYASRALSANGDLVFFESTDALVQRDTNRKRDVYQWELAGTGDCASQSAEFDSNSGGCISLISSGKDEKDTEFVDASADGSEVFIRTSEKLVSQDPGLIDIYAARVDGGFPSPPENPTPCEGEACQPSGPPARAPQTSSNTFVGPPTPKPVRPRKCGPGKHRVGKNGKTRCVPNKKSRRSGEGR
jgi:DNA-binding beta-propeller fold protein YncE